MLIMPIFKLRIWTLHLLYVFLCAFEAHQAHCCSILWIGLIVVYIYHVLRDWQYQFVWAFVYGWIYYWFLDELKLLFNLYIGLKIISIFWIGLVVLPFNDSSLLLLQDMNLVHASIGVLLVSFRFFFHRMYWIDFHISPFYLQPLQLCLCSSPLEGFPCLNSSLFLVIPNKIIIEHQISYLLTNWLKCDEKRVRLFMKKMKVTPAKKKT